MSATPPPSGSYQPSVRLPGCLCGGAAGLGGLLGLLGPLNPYFDLAAWPARHLDLELAGCLGIALILPALGLGLVAAVVVLIRRLRRRPVGVAAGWLALTAGYGVALFAGSVAGRVLVAEERGARWALGHWCDRITPLVRVVESYQAAEGHPPATLAELSSGSLALEEALDRAPLWSLEYTREEGQSWRLELSRPPQQSDPPYLSYHLLSRSESDDPEPRGWSRLGRCLYRIQQDF